LNNRLIWIDLEMTGLDPQTDFILEIATVITNSQLKPVAEGPNIAVHQPEELLLSMGEWAMNHHQKSGLLDLVNTSSYDCRMAEQATVEFVSLYCREGQSPLCGNSVWRDRQFLKRHMPTLEEFFHYRNIDVSSVKELVRRWYPSLPPYEKQKSHRALSDIKESIDELRFYRKRVFQP
jgi:oligoribonuclease